MPKSKSKRKSDQSINQSPVQTSKKDAVTKSVSTSSSPSTSQSTNQRPVKTVAAPSNDETSFDCGMALNFPFDPVPIKQLINQTTTPNDDCRTLYLKTILKSVRKRLYIQLAHVEFDRLSVSSVQARLAELYATTYQIRPDVDVVICFPMINPALNPSIQQSMKILPFIAEYPTTYSNDQSNNQSNNHSIKLFHRVVIPSDVEYLFACDFKTQAQDFSQQMSNPTKASKEAKKSESPKKRRTRADIEAEEAAVAARLDELINHTRLIGGIVVPAILSTEGTSHQAFFPPRSSDASPSNDQLNAQSNNQSSSESHSFDASEIVPPLIGVIFDPSAQAFELGPSYQIDWTAQIEPIDGLVHPVNASIYQSNSQSTIQSTNQTISDSAAAGETQSTTHTISTLPSNQMITVQSGDQSINAVNANFGQFNHAVLGGTFDHLHLGHKLLLSTGAFVARHSLLVGVTNQSMLTRKTLGDLIESPETRLDHVTQFVQAVRPDLEYSIMIIDTPAGPTTTDADISKRLDCMVASDETLASALSISKQRQEMNPPLQAFSLVNLPVFNMPPPQSVEQSEEQSANSEIASLIGLDKLSSTGKRFEMIGKYLGRTNPYPWTHTVRARQSSTQSNRPYQCYVVGLTGGIASGKSNIAKNLQQCGAHVIDCDLIGHACYKQGEPAYDAIIERFGRGVVGENGEINRPKLGSIVFADPGNLSALNDLNGIVWPAIKQRVLIQLSALPADTIAVVEAAVMLEAGWGTTDSFCDELWIAFVPQIDAITRIQERNGLSASEAARRVASQMDNRSRLVHADVILTSIFEKSVTQQLCELAWSSLLERVAFREHNQAGMLSKERFEHAINSFFRVPAKAKIIEIDNIVDEKDDTEDQSNNQSNNQSMEQSGDEKEDESSTPNKRRKKSTVGVLSAQSVLSRWWSILPDNDNVNVIRDAMFRRLDERAPHVTHLMDLVLATLFWNAKIGSIGDSANSSVKQEFSSRSLLTHSELLASVQLFGSFTSQLRLTNTEIERITEIILRAASTCHPNNRRSRYVRPAAATFDQAVFDDVLRSAGAV